MQVVPLLEDSIVFDKLFALFACGIQETFNTSSFFLELQQFVRVDSIRADKTTVGLSNTDQNSSIVCEKFRCPVSDITVALNDEFLSFETFFKTEFLQLLLVG